MLVNTQGQRTFNWYNSNTYRIIENTGKYRGSARNADARVSSK